MSTRPTDLAISWTEQAERAAWRQYDAAAECCAVQTLLRTGDRPTVATIPPVCAQARSFIDADPVAFWTRVDEHIRIIGEAALAEHWS